MATKKEIEDDKKKAAAKAKTDKAQQGQVRLEFNQAMSGLNMDSTINQVATGSLTYALNATVENFDSSSVNYQNEPGNEPCFSFPDGYELIGKHTIPEKDKDIFFLTNPTTGGSEIGFMFNNDCQYKTLINAPCLNFNVDHPIPKVVHRITNCTTEIYWTDGFNARRYLDIENIPYILAPGTTPTCDPVETDQLDCNQLKIQPDFPIPFLNVDEVTNVGSLVAGTYQFAIQYSDAVGNDLTSYYSITNPCPIADALITTVNFNYPVGKSIVVKISNLDISGQFNYFNLAVIKTINNISSVELVGTYNITEVSEEITYTGADQTAKRLSMSDIFEKYPYYDIAQDITSVQDILVWDNLTSIDRINYQQIASNITLNWESYRIPPGENYSDENNATNLRGYMRDEVYAFEIVFLLKNGKQTDSFHIPGPPNLNINPDVPDTNDDFIGDPDYVENGIGYSSYWKIYNNALNLGASPTATSADDYKGPWEYGEFAYWESTEKYPCNTDVWGDLADQPIRHHKFPDVLVSPIIENSTITYDGNNIVPTMQDDAVFPIGVKINNSQISGLILTSDLTQDQKDDIVGFKIVRGDRSTNRSVIAKGILRNMGKYSRNDQEYYYPNYPYNQVSGEDSFLQENNNAWNYKSKAWLVYMPDQETTSLFNWGSLNFGSVDIDVNVEEGVFTYTSIVNGRNTQAKILPNCIIEVCSLTRPVALRGLMTVGPADFDAWRGFHGQTAFAAGYAIKSENPFNNFNFDGTVASRRWLDYQGSLTSGGGDTCTVLTNVDYDYDYDNLYGQVTESGDGHIWKPQVSGANSGLSIPRINLNGIIPGPCFESDDTSTEEIEDDALITYPPGTFDPANECPEGQSAACQECIKTENPDNITPWPQAAFGQPTNPLPQLSNGSPSQSFPLPTNQTNTFTPAANVNEMDGSINGTTSRWSRRSCLACDRDIPIKPLEGAEYESVKDILEKQIFNSPDTSFGQPFLGSVLKLESVMFGAGKGHFVEVKDNAKYKLLSKEAQEDALKSSERIAALGSGGFNAGIMFTVYQSYLTIYINGITRKNYGMSFNSRANYDYSYPIDNNVKGGIKQREIELTRYLIPGVQSFNNNDLPINNWNRESSVYIKTKINDDILAFPLPQDTPSLTSPDGTSSMVEFSRFNISEIGACDAPEKEKDMKVVSYYASMKNILPNQWGQINSFKRIDTGYQKGIASSGEDIIFGGDVYISRFTFKTKLPFFIDNRVNAPDDSDIFFDEIGNIAYPKYWHSARSILNAYRVNATSSNMLNLISTKAHNLDCPSDPSLITAPSTSAQPVSTFAGTYRSFYDGFMYLFAYGVPNFYCESVYNTDLRQAFNTKEGDFWPHVSSSIPDDWVQETNVPIAQDNTYYYNVTFSKQNKENVFTQLPPDWENDLCFTYFPFRAIYSDTQGDSPDNRVNNWLVYRAISYHDFPQNYGNLTSLDGVQDKAILARFENKALLYNNLLTIDTSNPQAAYVGNSRLFDGSPPLDFAETDLGYVGSQHKFLLKVPYGQITADAKRGQIFLLNGNKPVDMTSYGSGVNRFMTSSLPFEILEYFPEVNVDNNFTGFGLHGVYDSKFDRVIITKIDYIPTDSSVFYDKDDKNFYIPIEGYTDTSGNQTIKQEVFLNDRKYFCNKSWTMSFDFNTKSWISFHSYLPNFYIGENNFYYSGINGCCTNFTAILDNPSRSRIDTESPNLEMIVGEFDGVVKITTTTTTTGLPLFTTTTTTAYVPDCEFDINVVSKLDCQMEGVGYITVPTPTTTTICARPDSLVISNFTEGYQITGQASPVLGTLSAQKACAVGSFVRVANPLETVDINFQYQYEFPKPVTVGQLLYFGGGSDCTFVPDGWYTSSDDGWNKAYYVENSRLEEIIPCDCNTLTTTTTLYDGELTECCGIIYNDVNGNVKLSNIASSHSVDSDNFHTIVIPGYTTGKLAIGPSTLYAVSPGFNTTFKKWEITTNPWTVEVGTDLTIADNAFGTTAGIAVKDDNTLIAIDTSQGYIVEIDASTGIPSQKILVGGGYTYTTNLLYTTKGKLITIGEDGGGVFHYFQWDYDNETATPEIDITITASEFGSEVVAIYECDCDITIITKEANQYNVFSVSPISPYDVVFSGTITDDNRSIWNSFDATNVTQMQSCVNPIGGQEFTTTTSTTESPSTTTTTSIYPCYKWEITGPVGIIITDCNGLPEVLSVPSGVTQQFCTNVNTGGPAGATFIGNCDI